MKLPEGIDPRVEGMAQEALTTISEMLTKQEISLQGGLEKIFEIGFECGRIRGIDDMDEVFTRLRSPK